MKKVGGWEAGSLYVENLFGGQVKTWNRKLTKAESAACQRFLTGLHNNRKDETMSASENKYRNEVVLAGNVMQYYPCAGEGSELTGGLLLLECGEPKKWFPCRPGNQGVREKMGDVRVGDFVLMKGVLRKHSTKVGDTWKDSIFVAFSDMRVTHVGRRQEPQQKKFAVDDDIPY